MISLNLIFLAGILSAGKADTISTPPLAEFSRICSIIIKDDKPETQWIEGELSDEELRNRLADKHFSLPKSGGVILFFSDHDLYFNEGREPQAYDDFMYIRIVNYDGELMVPQHGVHPYKAYIKNLEKKLADLKAREKPDR